MDKLKDACGEVNCTLFLDTDCHSERDISLALVEPTSLNSTQTQASEANFTMSEWDPVTRCLCCASDEVAKCTVTADGLLAVVRGIEMIDMRQDSVLGTDDDVIDLFVTKKSKQFLACNRLVQLNKQV